MSLREILCWPDPRLTEVCVPVQEITDDTNALAADMLETMYAAPGRGLAAPQVGVLQRLFVMDTAWKDADPEPGVFINPELTFASEKMTTQYEGCLSLPGIAVEVARPERVGLRWTDLAGQMREMDFDGFAAACVQHEMDHLDGRVTLDHANAPLREKLIAEYRKASA